MPAQSTPLANKLLTELYQEPALVPASPWLGASSPQVPRVRVTRNPSSGEEQVEIIASATVRALAVQVRRGDQWQTFLLPGAQSTLVIGSADAAPADAVLVRAIGRTGRESAAVVRRGARGVTHTGGVR